MSLRLDVTPGDDPLGTVLVEITDQDYHGLRVRVERNGGGSGQFLIHGDHAAVDATNFAYGNYVRVFDTDLSEYVAGFWLKEGEFTAVSAGEQGGRMLTFGGWGSVGYLGRARWAEAPYVASGTGVYNGPRDDGLWHWFNDQYGDILKRAIDEAQDADRPFDPIPDLTYDFANTTDSNGDPWSSFTGNYTIPMGTNYLDMIQELMRLGLLIWVTPDLLLQAFQEEPGTDRSSGSFASGKVRFEHGVNIVAPEDLTHSIHETPRVRHLLVQGSSTLPADVISVVDAGAPLVKEGYLNAGQTDDVDILTEAGEADLGLRAGVYDTARFIMVRGDNEGAGFYLPGWPGGAGHFWLSDLVTIHTGTEFADFNEAAMRVAAISWTVREKAGDVETAIELGSVYYSVTEPGLSQVAGGCSCHPNIPSGSYEFGTPSTVDYLWDTFPSGGSPPGEDDTGNNIGAGPKYGGGYVYAGALDASCQSGVFALTAGDYHFKATIRSSSSTGSPKQIRMLHDGTTLEISGDVGNAAQTVEFDFTAPATDSLYRWNTTGPESGRKSEVYYVEISHGSLAGYDSFAGDDPPPASTDQIGSIGSGSMLALANHTHPAQSADVTLADDPGEYFDEVSVEDQLQELGEAKVPEGGADGQVLTKQSAADWDMDWEDPTGSGGGTGLTSSQGVTVTRAATQSISNATPTAVSFDTEVRDDGGYWAVSPNPTRITVATTGWYAGAGYAEHAADSDGGRRVFWRVNGSTTVGRMSVVSPAAMNDPTVEATFVEYLTAGDYLELIIDQNAGGNLNITARASVVMILALPSRKAWVLDTYSLEDYPSSPNSLDDEFEGGGSIDAKWTKVNDPASADALNQTDFAGMLHVGLSELGTDNFDNLVRMYQTPPSGAATMVFVARIAVALDTDGSITEGGEFCGGGVYLGNSVNDEAVGMGIQFNIGTVARPILVDPFSISAGTISAASTKQALEGILPGQFVWVRLRKTTANAYTSSNDYAMDFSRDGIIWQMVGAQTKTFTTACDEVGLAFRRPKSQTGTPHGQAIVDAFRRTA